MEFCLMFGEAAGLSRRRQSLPMIPQERRLSRCPQFFGYK
jgi:hypothetical protein